MQPKVRKILNNSLTAVLVLGTLFGTYLFSVAATFGLYLAVFPGIGSLSYLASTIITFGFLVTISLIILIPLARFVWLSPGKRWATTRSVALLLWPYLVFSLLFFCLAAIITARLNWLPILGPTNVPLQLSGAIFSIGLAKSYHWYIKRIKKTLLLK